MLSKISLSGKQMRYLQIIWELGNFLAKRADSLGTLGLYYHTLLCNKCFVNFSMRRMQFKHR